MYLLFGYKLSTLISTLYTVIDCGDPGSPINGGRSLPATTYQSQVTYTCNNGYQLDGEATRQCQANGKWSGFLPSCAPVDCGDPGSVTNGNRVLLSTTFTSVVLYSCNIGYRLEGDQRRTCQANGQWSNRLPSCARKEMSSLYAIHCVLHL